MTDWTPDPSDKASAGNTGHDASTPGQVALVHANHLLVRSSTKSQNSSRASSGLNWSPSKRNSPPN